MPVPVAILRAVAFRNGVLAALTEAADNQAAGGVGRAYKNLTIGGEIVKVGVELDRGQDGAQAVIRIVRKGAP